MTLSWAAAGRRGGSGGRCLFIGTAVLYPLALAVLLTIPRTTGHSEDSLQEG